MYTINGERFQDDPSAKLGGGSEGTVYAHPKDPRLCVKIFHPVDKGDKAAADIAAYRARKVDAICRLRLALPPQFTLPQVPALDDRGQLIGFQMQRVRMGFLKLMRLLEPAFRTSNQFGLQQVVELYARLFEDLALIHGSGLVVGDVNMGCLLFTTDFGRAWVDTDSWSYPGFPCLATTEMFAHPDLYPNLRAGGTFVEPKPHHDAHAFLVAFTLMALPGAHPFRMGAHPRVHGLQDRATQGITIFDKDVTYPKMLVPPEVLSDDLLSALIERLKRIKTDALDPEMLREFGRGVVTCKCGEQYHGSRKACPRCQKLTVVDMTALLELVIKEILRAPGALLFAQVVDGTVNVVCRVGSKARVIRIDGQGTVTTVGTELADVRGARYRFFADCLAVCENPLAEAPVVIQTYRIANGTLVRLADTSTGILENESALFDTSARFLYRTAGNSLMRSEPFGSTQFVSEPIAQVHRNQSWFAVDHASGSDGEVIFGYDRALRDWEWFVIQGDKAGKKFHYNKVGNLPLRTGESLEDFSVYFNSASVLLVRKTRYQGRESVRYSIIALNGTVQRDALVTQDEDGFKSWEHLRGKLFQGTSILHVTPDGIVKQDLASGTYAALKDTSGVVTADDRLVRFGRTVGIIRHGGVLTMAKK